MRPGLRIETGQIVLGGGARTFRLRIDDLTVPAGAALALTGASGSGKTLVLELLGLLRASGPGTRYGWTDAGGTRRDLAGLWRGGARGPALARMRGRLFGFVPQTGGLLPFLTVAENVALPQRLNGCADAGWCRALIARLDLARVAAMRPGDLSIGQRQRTAIARALAHRPPFVIADEPTAALDPPGADRVLALLLETARDQGCGVILSSHDPDRIARFGIPRLPLETGEGPGGAVESRLRGGAPC